MAPSAGSAYSGGVPKLITTGSVVKCAFGAVPNAFTAAPGGRVMCPTPAATVADCVPLLNIPSFGMCSSMGNPAVSAATAAASGVLTPQPCVPVIAAPWTPGSPTVLIGGVPALTDACKCSCAYGGTISFVTAAQFTVECP